MKLYKEAQEFTEAFKHLDPIDNRVDDPDAEFEPIPFLHEETPKDKR